MYQRYHRTHNRHEAISLDTVRVPADRRTRIIPPHSGTPSTMYDTAETVGSGVNAELSRRQTQLLPDTSDEDGDDMLGGDVIGAR